MPRAPLPPTEVHRLAALRRLGLLDTAAEQTYDDFTAIAAHVCGTPIALITLVDEHRQWFKSRVGLEASETPREHAFCAHAILEPALLEVSDATGDPRFADNPLVLGAPHIRFYAGQPLQSPDGFPLGTLCVIDRVPRALTGAQREALAALSRQVEAQLALRDTVARLDATRQSLEEEQTFSRGLLDSMLEGLVILAVDGRVEFFNPAAETMFGLRQRDSVGRVFTEFLDGAPNLDTEDGRARLAAAIGQVTEWQGLRASGARFPLEAQVWAFGPPGRRKLACHVRDLSQQREIEALKNRFVAQVSHELRTPLTAVRGALALLLDGESGGLDGDAHELATLAYRNSDRLVLLVNDILDFERLNAGGLKMDLVPTPLAPILDRAHDVMRAVAADAGVTVSWPRTTATVRADAERLVQVLVNLLSNAIKFSPPGGVVRVMTTTERAAVCVTVDDDGPGVPADQRAAIFEPFRQVEGSAAHRKKGTGLGLSICRAILAEHDGEIGVIDRFDGTRGARFFFTVPLV